MKKSDFKITGDNVNDVTFNLLVDIHTNQSIIIDLLTKLVASESGKEYQNISDSANVLFRKNRILLIQVILECYGETDLSGFFSENDEPKDG